MFLDYSTVFPPIASDLCCEVVAADLDGDGEVEVFVCGVTGPNRLLKWTGSALRIVTPPELSRLAGPVGGTFWAAAADFDGDGRDELYLATYNTAADRLLDPTPAGGWIDLFDRPENQGLRNFTNPKSVAAIDRRGTGRYGFLVANCGGPLRLFESTPAGPVTDLAPPLGINLATRTRGVLVAPLVGDRPDIFCANERGPNLLFRNTGLGTFLEVASEHGLADPDERSRAATVVDLDVGLGLCCGNGHGPHQLMARQPDGTFRDLATPALALPSDVRAVVAADFDNDGYEELFFNNFHEPNRLFRFRPGSGWVLDDPGDAAEPDGNGTGMAVVDLDGDGRLELLIAHAAKPGSAASLTLYRGPRSENAWLRVRPLTRFGASARGAVVRLTAAGRDQLRVIDGTGQTEPVAHFGLGRDPSVETVTIAWPDGATATLDRPPSLRTITVPYPGG